VCNGIKSGISRLQQNAQDNLLWFTSKVMPAVQKKYKPIQVDEPQQGYYHLVTPLDEAVGLLPQELQGFHFILKMEIRKENWCNAR